VFTQNLGYTRIVICVLVLAVMIALATPFGSFVSEAVQSTTKGLFDVNKSALDSTGLINIDNQEFDVPDGNGGAETPAPVVGATFTDGTFLTWEELKTQYDVTDTTIATEAFAGCTTITNIIIPNSVRTVGQSAFANCYALTNVAFPEGVESIDSGAFFASGIQSIVLPKSITHLGSELFAETSLNCISFNGTVTEWNTVATNFNEAWNGYLPEIIVTCSDGTVTVPVFEY